MWSSFGVEAFNKIECVIGSFLYDAAKETMHEALQEEIKLTMKEMGEHHCEWVKLDNIHKKQVVLDITI